MTDALVKELETVGRGNGATKAEQAAKKLVGLMLAGDVAAAKLVMSYVEGLPVQPIDVTLKETAAKYAAELGVDASELIAEAERIASRA